MTATESEATGAKKTTVTVTVDGVTFEAEPGELLIKAAQDNGIYIPRFCWHERMKPVGMCRMCLVEVEGGRGFPPACTTPVADGMVAHSQSDAVKQIQDGVLEFLLINHPLDCPVCDRGGECPLQDQTLAFGPGESRFVEEKRHFPKPIPLSELVLLDRERCIQCARCIRFADEIAGDTLIDFIDRGDRMQVLNFEEQPFDSYFSGNTVQICPVGALTATQYRFRARPWDLSTVETSCTTCSVHCRGAVQSSSNRLVRLLAVDSEPVNHGWLCDKGRYGLEWVHSERRVLEPQLREGSGRRQVSWPDALDRAADAIEQAKNLHGAESIAVLGGARGTNEDAFAWAALAKGVIGTDNVDAQLGDGLPADFVLGMERAEIADLDRASAIVVLDQDLRDQVPVLFLRVRRAMFELGVPLVDLAPAAHPLSAHAAVVARTIPGESIAASVHAEITRVTQGRTGPVVVIAGRGNLAASAESVVGAAADLARMHDVLFLSALRRGNVHGALDAGLAPGFLPGRIRLAEGRAWFADSWPNVPEQRGMDAEAILRAAADGKIRVLILLGADLVSDFPDATLARRALDAIDTIIAVDGFDSESTQRAEVFLPSTLWGEKAGTVTNLEGRVQRVGRKVAPEGTAMDDWRIATELALRLGRDFDLATVDEVTDEIARLAPALAGVTAERVKRARDGVVVPVAAHLDEIVLRTGALSLMADDGSGTSWDPIKVEGEVPAEPVDAAEVSAAADAPELHEWDRLKSHPEAPARDAYALRLVVGRSLYDDGRLVSETPLLQRLVPEPALRVHPSDLARIGVDSGGQVKVTSTRGSQVVAVRSDAGVPAGIACMDFSADALGAALLIDAAQPVIDLRVESLR
ncbi:MAG TPA: NADH-quinone oxidoreductase subunit NuoG [Acidimicrobiia bacterium]|nr:NADH-quinone oxidoreductase subunit NuoG [Acidimicrobiia bacterium]